MGRRPQRLMAVGVGNGRLYRPCGFGPPVERRQLDSVKRL